MGDGGDGAGAATQAPREGERSHGRQPAARGGEKPKRETSGSHSARPAFSFMHYEFPLQGLSSLQNKTYSSFFHT